MGERKPPGRGCWTWLRGGSAVRIRRRTVLREIPRSSAIWRWLTPAAASARTFSQRAIRAARRVASICVVGLARDLEAGPARLEHLLQGRAGVLDQMKPIRHLQRLGSAHPGPVGVRLGAIAHEHLAARMLHGPGRQHLGFALQEIDRPMGLKVHQQGRVGLAPARGQVVDPQHPRRHYRRRRVPAQQAEQRLRAGLLAKALDQAGTGLAPGGGGHPSQIGGRFPRPLSAPREELPEIFRERRTRAGGIRAAEAPHRQDQAPRQGRSAGWRR